MSNFTPSNLVAGQAIFTQKFQSGEWRMPDTAVLAAMAYGEKANPFLAELRKREDRSVYAYLPIRRSKGSAVDRTYNHTGDRGDSAAVTLSWDSMVETFSISIKQNDNNIMSFEENYAAQMQSCVYNLLERHETAKLAQLIADRTEICKGRVQGTWDDTNFLMKINSGNADKFFQNIRTGMKNNLFRNNIMVIADSLAYMNADFASAQGQANATNLGFQFNGMNIAMTTNDIFSDYDGSAIAFPMEMAGIVPWIPKQNRKPLDPALAMSYVGDYGSFPVSVLDDKGNVAYTLDIAIHAYAQRSDTSSSGTNTNGSKQDVTLEVELSLDMAYVSAPLSNLRATGDFAGKTDSVVYGFGISPTII